jgi:hypothetical protein
LAYHLQGQLSEQEIDATVRANVSVTLNGRKPTQFVFPQTLQKGMQADSATNGPPSEYWMELNLPKW